MASALMVETFCLPSASASRRISAAVGADDVITDAAQRTTRLAICASTFKAFTAIVHRGRPRGLFSPGQTAAHDGHGRLAEGE